MVLVHSATKGLSAMTLAVAHSRGWLDYEERVAAYWPEFAQQGKEAITVRQLLAHQAGLFALDEPVDRGLVLDPDRLATVLARQKPVWPPGTRQAYHAITLGFYEGELIRRIDPWHRSLGQFFQNEIATPLDLDVYIRLPESIDDSPRYPGPVSSSSCEGSRRVSRLKCSILGRGSSKRCTAPSCHKTRNVFTRGISKFHRAVECVRPAAWRTPIVCLRPMVANWAHAHDTRSAGRPGDSAGARLL
jgi:CubicO group peptidase (beta-lactamase class C family)